jgi:hypothetical protein
MRLQSFLALGAAGVVLSGCAGAVAPFVNNPYAGNYRGTFATSDGRSGPASVDLTNIGNVFGTLTDTVNNQNGSLPGSVNTNGTFSGTVAFPESTRNVQGTFNSSNGNSTMALTGPDGYTATLTLGSNGN